MDVSGILNRVRSRRPERYEDGPRRTETHLPRLTDRGVGLDPDGSVAHGNHSTPEMVEPDVDALIDDPFRSHPWWRGEDDVQTGVPLRDDTRGRRGRG